MAGVPAGPYHVVTRRDRNELIAEVNRLCAAGFRPEGGVSVVYAAVNSPDGSGWALWFSQAVHRPDA